MSFEVELVLARLDALLKASPNRSDFKELMELKKELEEVLAQEVQCNTCKKAVCPVVKERKNEKND